jgi:PKD repeat protein
MEWLHRFDFPANDVESIEIDDAGGVLYVDPALPEAAGEEQATGADDPLPELAASAADDAFLLHSRPGAPNVVYLDFDGHTLSGTAWSSGTIQATPYDLDGDPASFSEVERTAIAEIWHRVAEDLAAFDIDVTTEEPASFGPYTGRVLITSKTDANGSPMPYNTGGGVAYVNVWGRSDYASYWSPALVYFENLGSGTTYIAEASAHEFGHNLGLSHDGTSTATYYPGHGSGATSWAPIMGNSYYYNVTQWSKGEYEDANNTQDDIAIIASKLFLIADDHGDTPQDATPLAVDGSGQVLVSNPETDPHNVYAENKGVIEASSDQDVFVFTAGAGQVDLTVAPAWDAFYRYSKRGANLDIEVRLLDATGATLASSDPSSETDASISASVPGGTYYVQVAGVGNGNYSDYASAGQYFISGTVTVGGASNVPPTANFGFGCANLACTFTDASGDSDGSIAACSWDFGDGAGSAAESPTHTYAAAGTYGVTLTVTDDAGATDSRTQTVTVTEPVPNTPPSAGFTVSCSDLSCSFTDASGDSDGSIAAYAWSFGDGTGSAAKSPTHTYAGAGTYSVTLTVTDDAGATDASSRSVTVTEPVINTPPSADFTVSCADLSCSFTDASSDNDGSIVGYTWDFGDGTGASAQNPSHSYAKGGTYTVTLTVTDDAGATASASATVSVSGAALTVNGITPNVLSAKVTATVAISGSGFMPGASLSFASGAGPAPTVSWVSVQHGGSLSAQITIKGGGPKTDRYWDVVVTNPDGSTAVLQGGLTVTP